MTTNTGSDECGSRDGTAMYALFYGYFTSRDSLPPNSGTLVTQNTYYEELTPLTDTQTDTFLSNFNYISQKLLHLKKGKGRTGGRSVLAKGATGESPCFQLVGAKNPL